MLRLSARRVIAVTVAVAALALISATSARAGTDITGDPASASAPIEILGSPLPASGAAGAPGAIAEAVWFKDLAATSATSVDFTWLFVDANGAVIGEEQTSARGRFAPNVPVEHSVTADAHLTGYATGDALFIGDDQTNLYDPVDHVLVMVDNATFADGSAWHADARRSNASPPVLSADPSVNAAHLRITRVASARANSEYDRVETRLSFANDSEKRIDAVLFTYTFYDVDGNVLFQQPALVRGAYAHGAVSTLNPSTGVSIRGVVMNGGSVWMGWGSRPQYVARIVVGVDAIRYSDGTLWTKSG
jgi:hypothetical protein